MPSAVRVMVSTCHQDLDDRIPDLIKYSQEVRKEPGCLQFEYFRSHDLPENLARLELWESAAAWDAHWNKISSEPGGLEKFADGNIAHVQAPYHWGTPQSPRRDGVNSVEFYRHTLSTGNEGTFIPADPADQVQTLRWPVRSALRLILQSTAPTEWRPPVEYYHETRSEPGCLQFEHYRGVEFEENAITMELWASQDIYDRHFIHRNGQRVYNYGTLPAGRPAAPERRYGKPGMEFLEQSIYNLVGGVWQPENPAERMVTVRLA